MVMAARETVRFDEKGGKSSQSQTDMEGQRYDDDDDDHDQYRMSCMQKFVSFFNAPVVTFGYNTVSSPERCVD